MVVPAQRGVNCRPVSLLGSANLVRPRLSLDGPSNIASRHRPIGDRSDMDLHSSQVAGHDYPPSRKQSERLGGTIYKRVLITGRAQVLACAGMGG